MGCEGQRDAYWRRQHAQALNIRRRALQLAEAGGAASTLLGSGHEKSIRMALCRGKPRGRMVTDCHGRRDVHGCQRADRPARHHRRPRSKGRRWRGPSAVQEETGRENKRPAAHRGGGGAQSAE